jgi:predicted N-acetyltransferase YhbS
MHIEYKINHALDVQDIIELYNDSGLRRPTNDINRIRTMYRNSNLIVSAHLDGRLVGVARSLTDFSFCCYLSDLAVAKDLQGAGIGRRLIEITKEQIGYNAMLLLLSAPEAMEYYPKVGFETVKNGFIIYREQ